MSAYDPAPQPVVAVIDSVGKCYASYASNLHRFARWFGIPARPASEYWAVRDVSFRLRRGECVAIIGQNGAGKSTLLKLITGTVRPTTGVVHVAGKVSALLELGIGFNPDFTGRQNVGIAGGLMGLSTAQIQALMPAIEAFAEIGEFIDQPTRVYSSGMQARLAFSLATAIRPEVLIVDEILSVGDSYFRHKSFDRIRAFRESGTSIIFVSHAMDDVQALCDRVILLDKGQVLRDGLPDEIVHYYNALIAAKEANQLTIEQRRQRDGWLYSRSGSGAARVAEVVLTDSSTGQAIAVSRVGQSLRLSAEVVCDHALPSLVIGFMLRDRLGHTIWGTNSWHTGQTVRDVNAGQRLRVNLDFLNSLGPGSYSFSIALHASDTHVGSNFDWQDNVLTFQVVNADRPLFIGSSWMDARIAFDVCEAPGVALGEREPPAVQSLSSS